MHQPVHNPFAEQPASNGQTLSQDSSAPVNQNTNITKTDSANRSISTASSRRGKSSKVDPDKIPRPDMDPQSSYNPKRFVTSQGNSPPPSTHNYITVDNGVAGPRYIRSSFYSLPPEPSTLTNTNTPFGVIIQPLAEPTADEEGVPIIDYSEQGPFRCSRCKTYVNPHFGWTDGGRLAICNICKMQNKVPSEHFAGTNEFGDRRDKLERHELCKGVYEFLAPKDYHNRALVAPSIAIAIDVSAASVGNGIFGQILSSLESLIEYIPSPELTRVALFTFDQSITYFQVPEDLSKELGIVTVCDVDDYCVPFPPETLFMNIAEQKDKLMFLVQKVQKYYETLYESQPQQKAFSHADCFGAALNNCGSMLSKQGGRALIFTTSSPTRGTGKLKRRDDYNLIGTEKEKSLFNPQNDDYESFARRFLENRVGIDMFVFSPEYFDLATTGVVPNSIGGNIYYYPQYNGVFDGEKLHYDIARNLTRTCGYDAVMNVRTSAGLSFADYLTPAGRRPNPILELSTIDADHTITVNIKMEEKQADENAYIQSAILYTNQYGQRVIRVINLAIKVSNDLMANFRGMDVEVVGALLLRKNMLAISTHAIKQIRESIINQLVSILYSYRYNCASQSSPAQLILPEALKLLPCYILSALKLNALRTSNDTKPDARSYDIHRFANLPVNHFSNTLYNKVYPIHTIYEVDELGPGNVTEEGRVVMLNNVAASIERFEEDGIYLVDSCETIYLYVTKAAQPEVLAALFDHESVENIMNEVIGLPVLENDYNTRVNNIVEQLRKNKNGAYQNVRTVVQGDPFERYIFQTCLIEDQSKYDSSLTDFLCEVHKLIQQKYN